jgi:tRNA pseudouridine38-40 synthase
MHRDRGFEQIWIEIEGNGFLYMMVRNIVGTLVEVGRGNHGPDWPAEVLASRDRTQAGMSAPAQGLFLLRIWCDDDPAAVAKFGLKEPREQIAEVE